MTTDEAISELQLIRESLNGGKYFEHSYEILEVSALDMAIEALKREQWIPVSERLPRDDGMYNSIACNKYGDIMAGHIYKQENNENYYCECDMDSICDVIAWMPLP